MEGKKITGVEFHHKGNICRAMAGRAVVLSAGAINSPKILELSGIGNAKHLHDIGVPVRHDLAGVGENLQDHLQIRTVFKIQNATTLNQQANSWWGKMKMAAQYALTRSGPLSMAPSQLGLFARSDQSIETPDLEFHIQPLSTDKLGDPLHPFPAITVSVCNLRPESRGSVHIQSRNTLKQPDIQTNYLSTEGDRNLAAHSILFARKIMQAKAIAPYHPEEYLPGPSIQDEQELIKEAGNIASTIFHPVGTCKMAPSLDQDNMSVVNDRLKVHGLDGLYVADASVMPQIVSGNTNSPVVMIGEKCADMLLE